MGSTGSGNFSDYPGTKKVDGTGSGAGGGGSSGVDKCQQAFECTLEEVAQCTYHMQTQNVPAPRAVLTLMIRGRVFAVDANGLTVGALPTAFNYLAACLADGKNYIGVVKSSSISPVPTVAVDFTPR